MTDITHVQMGRFTTESREWWRDVRLALADYATFALVTVSVACGPGLVWLMLWMAARP